MQYAVKTAVNALEDYLKTVEADIAQLEEKLKPKDTTSAKLESLHKIHEQYLQEYDVFVKLQDGDDTKINNGESLENLHKTGSALSRVLDSLTYRRYSGTSDWDRRDDRQRLAGLNNRRQHIQSVITSLGGAQEENISTAELERFGFFKIIRF